MRKKGNSGENKKIIFMGTPLISTFALQALIDNSYEVIAVITQPDKPIGRKKELIFSPIKKLAIENNIKVYQPQKTKELIDELSKLEIDAFLTCAFGQFIPDSVLNLAKFGCFNVHASLLPKYRGGAPIHWSIINGEKKTGLTLMRTIKKMDAGEMYSIREIELDEKIITSELFKKMQNLVYDIVFNDFHKIFNNELKPVQQNENEATFAYNISKEQEKINLNDKAINIHNWIRGLSDAPGGFCIHKKKKIKLFNSEVLNQKSNLNPGVIVDINKHGMIIATQDFDILVKEIQIESKKRVFIKDILNGLKSIVKLDQLE